MSKRPRVCSVVTGVLLLLAAGCTLRVPNNHTGFVQGSTGATSAFVWVQSGVPVEGFSLSIPGRPSFETETKTDDTGVSYRQIVGKSTTSQGLFAFLVATDDVGFPGDPITVLREFDVGFEGRAIVLEDRFIERQGFPGRRAKIELRATGHVAHLQLFQGRKRVYGTYVLLQPEQEAALRPHIQFFLDSVRMDQDDAPAPLGDGRFNDEWAYVYPVPAFFACDLPGKPRRSLFSLVTTEGPRQAEAYTLSDDDGRRAFEVVVVEYDGRPTADSYAAVLDRFQEKGLQVAEHRDGVTQGFASRSVSLHAADRRMEARVILTSERIYVASATVPTDAGDGARAEVDRFFESFRIL